MGESEVEELQSELKVLKNEIQESLVGIKEYLLTYADNPFLVEQKPGGSADRSRGGESGGGSDQKAEDDASRPPPNVSSVSQAASTAPTAAPVNPTPVQPPPPAWPVSNPVAAPVNPMPVQPPPPAWPVSNPVAAPVNPMPIQPPPPAAPADSPAPIKPAPRAAPVDVSQPARETRALRSPIDDAEPGPTDSPADVFPEAVEPSPSFVPSNGSGFRDLPGATVRAGGYPALEEDEEVYGDVMTDQLPEINYGEASRRRPLQPANGRTKVKYLDDRRSDQNIRENPPEPSSDPVDSDEETDLVTVAMLAPWLEESMAKIGKTRIKTLLKLYADIGGISQQRRNLLLQMLQLENSTSKAPASAKMKDSLQVLANLETILTRSKSDPTGAAMLAMYLSSSGSSEGSA